MGIVQNIGVYLAVLFAIAATVCAYEYEAEWENFKVTYNKTYESPEHESLRFKIFLQELEDIAIHNEKYRKGLESYTTGINELSDMTVEEMQKKLCGFEPEPKDPNVPVFYESNDLSAPDSIDWRQKGAVTEVRQQGDCESCYAFSAVAALEGQSKIKKGKLVSLSEQEIVDCSKKEGNNGCNRGFMVKSFTYVKNNKGIDTRQSYPYVGKEGECKFKKENIGATCNGPKNVNANENALKEAVATIGPISVGVATGGGFKKYTGGIFQDTNCGSQLNHGVTVVGYGSENGKDYWIIKNSFGTNWGEKGYMRMIRGKNLCGISNSASYPLM